MLNCDCVSQMFISGIEVTEFLPNVFYFLCKMKNYTTSRSCKDSGQY